MMRCYIAGPMTGHLDYNFAAFDRAKDYLEGLGMLVLSPADNTRKVLAEARLCTHDQMPKAVYELLVRWDIAAVMNCDTIFMLRGWEKSTGARAEHALAAWMGKDIMYERDEEISAIAARYR